MIVFGKTLGGVKGPENRKTTIFTILTTNMVANNYKQVQSLLLHVYLFGVEVEQDYPTDLIVA